VCASGTKHDLPFLNSFLYARNLVGENFGMQASGWPDTQPDRSLQSLSLEKSVVRVKKKDVGTSAAGPDAAD
jgi:hypothetical protein